MPIRTSSDAYRDVRNQLWPSQVRLRKLSDMRKHSIAEQKGSISMGPIYNIASNKNMAPVLEAPTRDLDEHTCEIPWIKEMRRMTVNPAPLSESHLERLRKCHVARRKKIHHHNHGESDSQFTNRTSSESHSHDDDDETNTSCGSVSASSDDDDNDIYNNDGMSDLSTDIAASELKTKALLQRSKKLAQTVSIIKPSVTATKSVKLRTTQSFPGLKELESIYKPQLDGGDSKIKGGGGRSRKISTAADLTASSRSSTVINPAAGNTRKASNLTRNKPGALTRKMNVARDIRTTTKPPGDLDTSTNKIKTVGPKKTLRRANTDLTSERKEKDGILRVRRKSMITIDDLSELHGNKPILSVKRR